MKMSSQHLGISGVSGRREVVLNEFTHVHFLELYITKQCKQIQNIKVRTADIKSYRVTFKLHKAEN